MNEKKLDESSISHERHESDWHEWSTDITARKSDGSIWPDELPRRLFVRFDADCLIGFTISDAAVTSENPGARELSGRKDTRRLVLADEDAVWLRDTLSKAIELMNERDKGQSMTDYPKCFQCGHAAEVTGPAEPDVGLPWTIYGCPGCKHEFFRDDDGLWVIRGGCAERVEVTP